MKRNIYYLTLFFGLVLIAFSLLSISFWINDSNKTNQITKKIKDLVDADIVFENYTLVNPPQDKTDSYWYYSDETFLQVDFSKLLEENNNTVGWIKVNGTKIDYPVVQTTDNDYYLTHSFDNSYNKSGWIYLDYRNDLNNLTYNNIIYGHGRKDYTMFGSLREVLKDDWYNDKKNHIVKLSTPKENTIWQVFSVYSIPSETYYIKTYFKDKKTFKDFLDIITERSKFDFLTEVNINDKILTLSTCLDTYGNRIVLHAKLIKKGTRLN